MRNYETHPSRNKFFCRGRFLTGGDSPLAFIASLGVTLGITGVWFGTTCVWWWRNESPAVAAVGAYLCLITISTMLTTVRLLTLTFFYFCHIENCVLILGWR
jgi:palmitoyltransferase ZDHHC9/14/18